MAFIFNNLIRFYYYLNEDIADPMTQNWPLMRTPWLGLCLQAVYLVTVLKWLPRYMENRPAYELRKLVILYNALQMLFCGYVVYHSLKLGWLSHYLLVCQPLASDANAVEYAWNVCYGYFVIKLIDLLDTIFFILRKKTSHVSFLHVYHHCGMVAVAWGITKWIPGGHGTLVILVNSFVHIIMYGYYLITAYDESCRRCLWWKKHVTQMQIIQFSLIFLHFASQFFVTHCDYPKGPAYVLMPQTIFILLLFLDFYYRAYIRPKVN